MRIDELDRDAYDAVDALLQQTPDGPEQLGMLEALAAVAALRYRAEADPFGSHGVAVRDTWTGWGRRGWEPGRGTSDDYARAANTEVGRLNGQCRSLVLAGQDPAVPDGDDPDELAVAGAES